MTRIHIDESREKPLEERVEHADSIESIEEGLNILKQLLEKIPYVEEDSVETYIGHYYSQDSRNYASGIFFQIDKNYAADFTNLEFRIVFKDKFIHENNGEKPRYANAALIAHHLPSEEAESNNGDEIENKLELSIKPAPWVISPYLMIKGTVRELSMLIQAVSPYAQKVDGKGSLDVKPDTLRAKHQKKDMN